MKLSFLVLLGCATPAPAPSAPVLIPVDGDPNGLFWNEAEQTLYIADDNGNRLLAWTEANGITQVATLPDAAPQGAGLGQVVKLADGTLVVTRFGGGTAGDVVMVNANGAQVIPGLDPVRRRIGLTVTASGKLFDTWFVRMSDGARVGAVGALSLDGKETEVITGLKKPVGVLAVGAYLYITDEDLGQVLKAPIDALDQLSVLTVVPTPDLIAAGPDGSIFTGGSNGDLYRIATTSGDVSVFANGFQEVRGVAYDGARRRLFVVDHDMHEEDGVTHLLHILPVD